MLKLYRKVPLNEPMACLLQSLTPLVATKHKFSACQCLKKMLIFDLTTFFQPSESPKLCNKLAFRWWKHRSFDFLFVISRKLRCNKSVRIKDRRFFFSAFPHNVQRLSGLHPRNSDGIISMIFLLKIQTQIGFFTFIYTYP